MKKIISFMLVLSLLAFPLVSAKELVSDGILNKFDNFRNCFGSIEKSCHQFDYDKDAVVGFSDFGEFIQKHTKMIKS